MENKHTEGKVRIEKDLITGELSMLIGITHILTITSGENHEHHAKYVAQAWNEHDQLTEQVKQLSHKLKVKEKELEDTIAAHDQFTKMMLEEKKELIEALNLAKQIIAGYDLRHPEEPALLVGYDTNEEAILKVIRISKKHKNT